MVAEERVKTVIEVARRAAGMSQQELADRANTRQSSVSEYESRRKSPTLEVVERLLRAAKADLVARPVPSFEFREDPEVGGFLVPDRLWSVPMPACFSRVHVLGYLVGTGSKPRVWDLSMEAERIDFYQWAIIQTVEELLLDSVDGVLLMQVWERLDLPRVVREAWQPAVDAVAASQDREPRDPGGFSAMVVAEMGGIVRWPPRRRRRRRRT